MAKRIFLFILFIVIGDSICISESYAEIKGVKPSEACDLFIDSGLSTSGWQIYYDYVCGCSSEHGHSISKNGSGRSLSYFVEGTCKNIRRLKLSIETETSKNDEQLIAELKNAARVLIKKVTDQPAPEKILDAISEGENFSMKIGESIVTVDRADWKRTTEEGTVDWHQITVVIE